MGHLNHIKGKYESLLERLNSNQIGLPYPKSDRAQHGWQEILEIVYSAQDADLASKLPLMPADISLIAKRTGLSVASLKPRLDAMAYKGIVMDLVSPTTGEVKYMLAPPVVGFFEFSLMRVKDSIPKKRMAEALDAYCHGDDTFAKEAFLGDTVVGRSMVNEEMIDQNEKPDILDWDRSTGLIKEARNISVAFCYCRHKMMHLNKACDAPVDSCLSINSGADYINRHNFGRKIDAFEALDILTNCREQGLVQIADNVQNMPSYICNCCSCCCGQLKAISDFDINAVNPSAYLPVLYEDKCSGCSKCLAACPIGAISMEPRSNIDSCAKKMIPSFNTNRCIGCGVCANSCSATRAIVMNQRKKRPYVPLNAIEKAVRMSIERGRLADLLFDYGASRGSRFMSKLIKALSKLSPVEKVLASKQVTSIFVKVALKTVKDPTE